MTNTPNPTELQEDNRGHETVEAEPEPEASGGRETKPEGFGGLARYISSTLGTVISDFDSKAESTTRSQDVLGHSLDRLTAELDKLLEVAPLPFVMLNAAKISSVRKRVSALNSLLSSIQWRIDNIERFISTGSSHGLGARTSSTSLSN